MIVEAGGMDFVAWLQPPPDTGPRAILPAGRPLIKSTGTGVDRTEHCMKTYARTLAEFVTSLDYAQIPPAVVEKAKACIIDTVAASTYGAQLPWSRIIIEYVKRTSAPGHCAILGTDCSSSGLRLRRSPMALSRIPSSSMLRCTPASAYIPDRLRAPGPRVAQAARRAAGAHHRVRRGIRSHAPDRRYLAAIEREERLFTHRAFFGTIRQSDEPRDGYGLDADRMTNAHRHRRLALLRAFSSSRIRAAAW
jgi:hypothetical protein